MEKKRPAQTPVDSAEKLPEQQRLIIQLRDIEELEFDQIAEIMETNINALRVSLSRARIKMREELTKYNEYGYQRKYRCFWKSTLKAKLPWKRIRASLDYFSGERHRFQLLALSSRSPRCCNRGANRWSLILNSKTGYWSDRSTTRDSPA